MSRRSLLTILVVSLVTVCENQDHAAGSHALSFEERVAAQRSIEEVYWRHRVWPAENPAPKPPLSETMPDALIRAKVASYLEKSNALETYWRRPITGPQLQAEMDRIAKHTRNGSMLRELFAALGNDPFLVAETLARPILVDRLARNWFAHDGRFQASEGAVGQESQSFDAWSRSASTGIPAQLPATMAAFELPTPAMDSCIDDSWQPTASVSPTPLSSHTAVWTGTEMIVWGGNNTQGWRYAPAIDSWTPMSTVSVPEARIDHTAIWTGTEMIVWGGHTGVLTPDFATGGRYNPVTDSWSQTSTVSAPPARYDHTAVWTGTEMIVWSGSAFSLQHGDGGRYNPSTDSWIATSQVNAPAPRYQHTAVWTGSEMIVWGGTPFEPDWPPTGGRYNPSTDTWTPTGTVGAPPGRYDHTAVWTGSRMIVWGGRIGWWSPNEHPQDLDTGGIYDPSTDSWTLTASASAPSPRNGHTAVWTGSEMIVWGGNVEEAEYFDTGGRFNPGTNSWSATSTSSVVARRTAHTAVWTGTEMIVWGGLSEAGSDTGGRYDPATDTWVPTSFVPAARADHTAVWTGSEMIVWGGDGYSTAGGRYDPTTDSWTGTNVTAAPAGRSHHTAVWTGNEMIVWGGRFPGFGVPTQTGGRYNPSTDSWIATSTASAPERRMSHSAVWTGTRMIVWGGDVENGSWTNTGGRYDPSTDTWIATATASAPAGRDSHTAVWTGDEMIVWGGHDSAQLATGGRYRPSTDSWTATSTASAPAATSSHAAVWTGAEMIVWGGVLAASSGGRYDPSTDAWTPTSSVSAPVPRTGPTAVWTGGEMIVWGGRDASGELQSGGRYSPSSDSWTFTTLASAPAGRSGHSAVWTGDEMIVWGGGSRTGGRYCACVALTWYPDSDDDGHGDQGLVRTSCTQPPGYVADHTDCNDASATVWSAPVTIENLRASRDVVDPATVVFSWDGLDATSGPATTYDVARGMLSTLRTGSLAATCASEDLPSSPYAEPGEACASPPGDGCWYLVRGENPCGTGSWGEAALDVGGACP